MDIQREVNVISEESIEYSKHLRFGSPKKIFDLANKAYDYARNKPDNTQNMREMRDLLWKLGHAVADSSPIDLEDIEVKVHIINSITDLGHALEVKMGAVRRMRARTTNYGESMIERAKRTIIR